MWVLLSVIVLILAAALVFWLIKIKFNITWYEWVIGLIGLAIILFTIQNYFGSLQEGEPKAARMFLLVAGLPGLILLLLSGFLAWRLGKSAANS